MTWLIDTLNQTPLAGLMAVVALGFTVGRLRWRGLNLGPAGGTLLIALGMGAAGLSFRNLYGTDDPAVTLGAFGFALFIYSVGFEAGPRFFSSLRSALGWRFVAVGVIINVVALAVAYGLGEALDLGGSVTAGLLAGALTSAPTYAAAMEVCRDPALLAGAFALTYPVGLVGLVVLVEYLPGWMRQNLAEFADDEDERDQIEAAQRPRSPELTRAFSVERDDVVGQTLAALNLTMRTGCYVTRVHRGPEIIVPTAETVLEREDHVLVRGRVDELHVFEKLVGPEIYDAELRNRMPAGRRVRVTSKAVHNKSLRELDLTRRRQVLVLSIHRGTVVLEPWPDLPIQRDDVLELVGPRACVRAAAEELGRFERAADQTDISVYAGGIVLGLLMGRLHFAFGGLDWKLGTAGGLLLAGVFLGRFRHVGRASAHVPQSARQLVRDLGILLFVAETGVRAGQSDLSRLHALIVPTTLTAFAVLVVPVVVAAMAGRWLLRLRSVDIWGGIGGGMTSSAALNTLRRAADGNGPALSYAASYAVASVLVTVSGPILIYLMR